MSTVPETASKLHTPPHSLQAEQSLLGGLMMDARAWDEISSQVSEESFYKREHRLIFRAMTAVKAAGQPIDIVTVGESLEACGEIDDVGMPYLGTIANDTPSAANIRAYAGIVAEHSRSRRILRTLNTGIERLHSRGADATAVVATIREDLEVVEAANTPDGTRPPPANIMTTTEEELSAVCLTPRCIVRNHTYADVAQLIAPGGAGKTTTQIYEAIQIALGPTLWGLKVEAPGWTLMVQAEDRREQTLARLREILAEMDLSPVERATAIRGVRIWDVTGQQVRLVTASDGNVILTPLADAIVKEYKADPPAVIVFDPLVSFGASEAMINDNEAAIITAARRIVRGLDCCVRLIHHTGKGNARGSTLDQYSGRGGSALADGTRMTTVLQSWKPGSGDLTPPPECKLLSGSSITVMARAKLSYAPPDLPLIWIRRTGFKFEHFYPAPPAKPEETRAVHAAQIERYLCSQLDEGRHHTRNTLEACSDTLEMRRADARAALSELLVSGRVVDIPLPQEYRRGGKKTYLHPTAYFAKDTGEVAPQNTNESGTDSTPPTTSPPLRGKNTAAKYRRVSSPLSPAHRRDGLAKFGEVGEVGEEEAESPPEKGVEIDQTEAVL